MHSAQPLLLFRHWARLRLAFSGACLAASLAPSVLRLGDGKRRSYVYVDRVCSELTSMLTGIVLVRSANSLIRHERK
jgi:hypothetical protein